MHKFMAGLVIAAGAAMLGGCYYEPGYSYVRGAGGGGAYYGRAAPVYDDGYYVGPGYYAPGYYGGYGGYYGSCCYSSGVVIGVGGVWQGRPRYWHGDDHRYHGSRDGGRHGGYRGHGGGYDHGGGHPGGRRSWSHDGHGDHRH